MNKPITHLLVSVQRGGKEERRLVATVDSEDAALAYMNVQYSVEDIRYFEIYELKRCFMPSMTPVEITIDTKSIKS